MTTTKNHGEHAEVEAFIGSVYQGKIPLTGGGSLPILEVGRPEHNGYVNYVPYNPVSKVVLVDGRPRVVENFGERFQIMQKKFRERVKSKLTGTYEIKEQIELLKDLGTTKQAVSSDNKNDIRYLLEGYGDKPLGFSVKTDLRGVGDGGLINASRGTRIVYRLAGAKGRTLAEFSARHQIERASPKGWLQNYIMWMKSEGITLEFHHFRNKHFKNNLDNAGGILSTLLIEPYAEGASSHFKELLKEDRKIARYSRVQCLNNVGRIFDYFARGMTPTKEFSIDKLAPTGGFLIVDEAGFRISLSSDPESYYRFLMNNTRLDTPSTTRHKFGFVYEDGGDFFIDLNLAVRITK